MILYDIFLLNPILSALCLGKKKKTIHNLNFPNTDGQRDNLYCFQNQKHNKNQTLCGPGVLVHDSLFFHVGEKMSSFFQVIFRTH